MSTSKIFRICIDMWVPMPSKFWIYCKHRFICFQRPAQISGKTKLGIRAYQRCISLGSVPCAWDEMQEIACFHAVFRVLCTSWITWLEIQEKEINRISYVFSSWIVATTIETREQALTHIRKKSNSTNFIQIPPPYINFSRPENQCIFHFLKTQPFSITYPASHINRSNFMFKIENLPCSTFSDFVETVCRWTIHIFFVSGRSWGGLLLLEKELFTVGNFMFANFFSSFAIPNSELCRTKYSLRNIHGI